VGGGGMIIMNDNKMLANQILKRENK